MKKTIPEAIADATLNAINALHPQKCARSQAPKKTIPEVIADLETIAAQGVADGWLAKSYAHWLNIVRISLKVKVAKGQVK